MPGMPSGSPLLAALLWSALAQTLRSEGLPGDTDDAALALDDACGGAGAVAPGTCTLSALQLRGGAVDPDGALEAGAAERLVRPGGRRRRTPVVDDITAEEEAKLERKIGRLQESIAEASEELVSLRDYENETRWLVTKHPPAGEAEAPPQHLATSARGGRRRPAEPTRSLHVAAAEDGVEEALEGLRKLEEQCSRLDAETRDELEPSSAPVSAAGAHVSAEPLEVQLADRLAALREELAGIQSQIPKLRTRAHATRRSYLKQVRTSGQQGQNSTAEDSTASSEGWNDTAEDSPASLEGFALA